MLFEKKNKSSKELVHLLIDRGLSVENEGKVINYLTNIGYFRLSAYFYPLLELPKENHVFKKGSSFKQAMSMYRFDRKLRLLIFNELEKIEIAIRSQITNLSCSNFNDVFWITNESNYYDKNKFQKCIEKINLELKNTKEDFILHFNQKYSNDYPPSWMLMEIIPFGTLTHIYSNLDDKKLMKDIAQYFGLQIPVFISWLTVLNGLRNRCCHHARVWNRESKITSKIPRKMKYTWIDDNIVDQRRLYYRLCMIQYLLFTLSPNSKFKEKLFDLIDAYPSVDSKAMGFPENWKNDKIWSN